LSTPPEGSAQGDSPEAPAPGDEALEEDDRGPAARCKGCQRKEGDPGFVQRSDVCTMAKRGSRWCTSCYTLWRTVYGGLGSLVLYEQWVSDPVNFTHYYQHLIAFLSLQAEGSARVSKAQIEGRVATLQWVFRFVRLPYMPHIVEPMPTSGLPVDVQNIVQMRDAEGQPRIGIARFSMSAPAALQATSKVYELPLPEDSDTGRFPFFNYVTTADPAEQARLESQFGTSASTVSDGSGRAGASGSLPAVGTGGVLREKRFG
jgi:hypothetical protein